MSFSPLKRPSHRKYRNKTVIKLTHTHHPGRHCASTGIRDLVNFHGVALDEPMCFGIGAGLGIWYLKDGNLPASRMIHVRSLDLEQRFFHHIRVPFEWEQSEDPQESENRLKACIDDGRPAIIQTDIYYLPYYQSSTHFPGHLITVWGYDAAQRLFFVTDTEREGLLNVPFEDLSRARFSGGGLFDLKGNLFAPQALPPIVERATAISSAITHNNRVLGDRSSPFQGLAALETWRDDLSNWERLDDWQWTARLAYQVIEKRGTGGGGFRTMYAEFLDAAASEVPEIASLGLPAKMRKAASAWTELAGALKSASERSVPDFEQVKNTLDSVRLAENDYHRSVAARRAC